MGKDGADNDEFTHSSSENIGRKEQEKDKNKRI
jgi:hypothetical protein